MYEEEWHGDGASGGQGEQSDKDRNEQFLAQVEDTGTFHSVVPVDRQREVTDGAAGHGEVLELFKNGQGYSIVDRQGIIILLPQSRSRLRDNKEKD